MLEIGNRMMGKESFESVCAVTISGRPECREINLAINREMALCCGDLCSAVGNSVG